jgi:hypothetical protein
VYDNVQEISRKKCAEEPRAPEIEDAVAGLSIEQAAFDQFRIPTRLLPCFSSDERVLNTWPSRRPVMTSTIAQALLTFRFLGERERFEVNIHSACNFGSDSRLMQFEGCLAH